MESGHILLAESNAPKRAELRLALEAEGHDVQESRAADETISQALSGLYDLLILDSDLARGPTQEICRAIRKQSKIGIIIVGTHFGTEMIDALNAGADEYVVPPYVLPEMTARVRALLRRVARRAEKEIVLEDRAIDLEAHRIKGPDGRVSHLTPKEFLVLKYLLAHADKPRTHRDLAQSVWQRDGSGEVEYVRIVIQQLRRKLEPDPNNPQYILTERSVGYRFRMPAPAGVAARP